MGEPIPIKNLLKGAIKRADITKEIKAAQICDLFKKEVQTINKKALNYCRPLSFKNKVLTVVCFTSSWAQELQMHQKTILEKINEKLKEKAVARIQFRLK